MKWFERMNAWLGEKGWTLSELSRRSGVDYESVAKYAKGNVSRPRGSTISKIAHAFGRTEQELLFGVAQPQNAVNYDKTMSVHGTKRVPMINLRDLDAYIKGQDLLNVWSGKMSVVVDESIGDSCIAIPVDDDSMLPEFSPGDMLICDPDADVQPGKFVIAVSKSGEKNGNDLDARGTAVFRKFRMKNPETIELKPLNDDYPTVTIDDRHPGHIVGRVVRVIKHV